MRAYLKNMEFFNRLTLVSHFGFFSEIDSMISRNKQICKIKLLNGDLSWASIQQIEEPGTFFYLSVRGSILYTNVNISRYLDIFLYLKKGTHNPSSQRLAHLYHTCISTHTHKISQHAKVTNLYPFIYFN